MSHQAGLNASTPAGAVAVRKRLGYRIGREAAEPCGINGFVARNGVVDRLPSPRR